MKKSTWVIEIEVDSINYDPAEAFYWTIRPREGSRLKFLSDVDYTRRDSALRGARRMAKRLRINADVE